MDVLFSDLCRIIVLLVIYILNNISFVLRESWNYLWIATTIVVFMDESIHPSIHPSIPERAVLRLGLFETFQMFYDLVVVELEPARTTSPRSRFAVVSSVGDASRTLWTFNPRESRLFVPTRSYTSPAYSSRILLLLLLLLSSSLPNSRRKPNHSFRSFTIDGSDDSSRRSSRGRSRMLWRRRALADPKDRRFCSDKTNPAARVMAMLVYPLRKFRRDGPRVRSS